MNNKQIFEEAKRIKDELKEAQEKVESLNKELLGLSKECPHEIVFKYRDDHPKKMLIDGNYFCPSCGRTIMCIGRNQLQETCFKESRIISLTRLSLFGTKETHEAIKDEVYTNLDFYYDRTKKDKELSDKMEEALSPYENKYGKGPSLIKKMFRNNP